MLYNLNNARFMITRILWLIFASVQFDDSDISVKCSDQYKMILFFIMKTLVIMTHFQKQSHSVGVY